MQIGQYLVVSTVTSCFRRSQNEMLPEGQGSYSFSQLLTHKKAKILHNFHNLHFMHQLLDPIWHYFTDVNYTSPYCQNTTHNVQLLHTLLK